MVIQAKRSSSESFLSEVSGFDFFLSGWCLSTFFLTEKHNWTQKKIVKNYKEVFRANTDQICLLCPWATWGHCTLRAWLHELGWLARLSELLQFADSQPGITWAELARFAEITFSPVYIGWMILARRLCRMHDLDHLSPAIWCFIFCTYAAAWAALPLHPI